MSAFRLVMSSAPGRPSYDLLRAVSGSERAAIEAMIEDLIGLLDEMDGEPDEEDDDPPEPSLGWSHTYATGTRDDREEDRPLVG